MSFIAFLFVGFLAGWIAGLLVKGRGFGCIGNVLIGAIGGLIGGFVFKLAGLEEYGGFIGSLLTAVIGALILVFVVALISKVLSSD